MRRKAQARLPRLGIVFLSIFVLLLSACQAAGSGTTSPSANVTKGGTWIDDIPSGPGSLLPNGSDTTYSVLIDQALYAPLFYGDDTGQIHPGITTEVPTVANHDVTADLKHWTFKLRPGLTWSDGQPLNADDLDFTWKTYVSPKFGAKFLTGFDQIDSADVSKDKLSITFNLKTPQGAFVPNWVDADPGAPLPKHKFESMNPEDILKSPDASLPTVVNGPFVIDTANTTPQNTYTLVPNPKYYQPGKPYLSKLVFRIVNNSDTILQDVKAGKITSNWFLDISQVDSFKAASDYTVIPSKVSAGFEALWFNTKNPALDVDVRKAIFYAVDRKSLVDNARNGFGVPLCTDHPASLKPGYQELDKTKCPDTAQTDKANQILDQAGWVKGADGVRAKNGLRLEFNYITTLLAWRKTDQLLNQQSLQKVGIKVNLGNMPGSTFFGDTLPKGQVGVYDIGEFQQTYSYDGDDASSLSCKSIPSADNEFAGQNYSFLCDHDMDKWFDQEQQTTDTAKRQEAFNHLHDIYLTKFPFATLYAPRDASVVKKTAHNYSPGPMGAQETVNVWDWWCDKGNC